MVTNSHFGRITGLAPASLGFAFLGGKWDSTALGVAAGPVTYSFKGATPNLSLTQAAYQQEMDRAFDYWEAVSGISFQRVPDQQAADIEISWFVKDGVNGTLAITELYVGTNPAVLVRFTDIKIYFDVADFTQSAVPGSAATTFFYQVALHEVGHALGLDHIDDASQIMYATFNPDIVDLGVGDINGAQALYGASGSNAQYAFGDRTSETIDRSSDTAGVQVFGYEGDDIISTGSGADKIFTGIGDDAVSAGSGNDILFSAFGNDTLDGGNGADNLMVISGDGLLTGGADTDVLRGGIGSDTLAGGSGSDTLIGDAFGDANFSSFWFGDDRLSGGSGNDFLQGGFGADVFVFAPDGSRDVVGKLSFDPSSGFSPVFSNGRDFEVGIDKIDVRGFNFSNEAAVMGTIRDSGSDAVISARGTTIVLRGVDSDTLSIEDFVWM